MPFRQESLPPETGRLAAAPPSVSGRPLGGRPVRTRIGATVTDLRSAGCWTRTDCPRNPGTAGEVRLPGAMFLGSGRIEVACLLGLDPTNPHDTVVAWFGSGCPSNHKHPVAMNPDLTDASEGTASAVIPGTESGATAPKVWVVRVASCKYADRFFSVCYATVDWFDLSSAESREELRTLYKVEYSNAPAGQIADEVGTLAAFRMEMDEGGYIITPASERQSLQYSRIVGPCTAFGGDDECRFRNRRAATRPIHGLGARASMSRSSAHSSRLARRSLSATPRSSLPQSHVFQMCRGATA